MTLPFGPVGVSRTAAQWALLHAGAEFLPAQDREIIWLRAGRYSIDRIAQIMKISALEVERSIGRSARTLATWERNASKWSTRFVAREPMSLAAGASPEREGRRRNVVEI